MPERLRYSVSLVSQGEHRFYTLTVPSDVLAKTTFVTTREEDPAQGFQRVLDANRAKQIADYIDNGLGTIPNSIVLSAQPDAELKIIGGGKTLEFSVVPKAFLIIDGQHRVFGFRLAMKKLRVPVVIYNGLSKKDEARLFIDINTKQRPVPNELLLDIKKLAAYEKSEEVLCREIYDYFSQEQDSPLLGLMTPTLARPNKISRVTFNAGTKPLLDYFPGLESREIYIVLRNYISSINMLLLAMDAGDSITNPIVFRAFLDLFPEITQRVEDKFSGDFSADNFTLILKPLFESLKPRIFSLPGNSHKKLSDNLSKILRKHVSFSFKR